MMNKLIYILIVGILFISGFGVAAVTSGATLLSQKQLEIQKSENKEKLEFVYLYVYVKEIYGTVDNPQYRPLANVTVEVYDRDIYGWKHPYKYTTNESGEVVINIINGITYKVTVSKDGYYTYGCSPFIIIMTGEQFEYYTNFTMAKDGSPFAQQISQDNQQGNSQSCQQSSNQLFFKILKRLLNTR